jgi:hypothetical protein
VGWGGVRKPLYIDRKVSVTWKCGPTIHRARCYSIGCDHILKNVELKKKLETRCS